MTEREPIVSVVTPTFNRADYLHHAIESVLAQTVDRFELLVVDDGSTDATPELMERYAGDPRIRYFRQPNQGQSVARNRGIREARGDFVCFLDSDNAWLPDKLAKSLEVFRENPECHVVYGDYIEIDQWGRELGLNRMRRYSGAITPELLKDNFVSMNTTMTRRGCFEVMGGFDEADRLAEDYGLWLRLSTRYCFYYLAEVLGFYRVMEHQISSDKRRRLYANEKILLSFLETYPDSVTSEQRCRGLSHFYLRRARFLASEKSYLEAYRDIGRSIRQDALWPGPWRGAAKVTLRAVIP
ncbi:glycosyltransferase [Marinobacter panjinensis]|uniref:Glycosyltransferase n=2 Tax=Marinobacter panjinensis TaxID=2576384 RepID=A0A4U6R910_9GAMM|nr:glycosyltransferase [Marinobacter panjinensis]